MNTSLDQFTKPSDLEPEQILEPPTRKLVEPGIATIKTMRLLRACVAYENTHQNRLQILQRLDNRATELRLERERISDE